MDVLLDTCGRRRRLLLIYLFVLKAAANCPKPEGKDNVVLTSDSLLMNEFPEGSVVTLECVYGHLKESGSDKITCISGQWTEPELICKKKDCGPPAPQPNMKFDHKNGTLFGAFVSVTCDKGYEISGLSFRQCLGDRWSGFSNCDIVVCEDSLDVANGKALWDSPEDPEYGQVIEFVCNDGYTLTGHRSITCSENGEYDPELPTCEDEVSGVSVTTEYVITTKTATTPAPQIQAVSTSTATSATSTAQEDKNIATSATPSVSSSAGGGRDTVTAEEATATTTASVTTTTSLQDDYGELINTQANTGSTLPAIITGLCILLIAAAVAVVFMYKFLLRRKGSYDTREDQKPELLQFQNL